MANKTCPIFSLLGLIGFLSLWFFVLSPAMEATKVINMFWLLYFLDPAMALWTQLILPGLTFQQLLYVYTYITTMPIQVNFWGLFKLDLFTCFLILAGVIGFGVVIGFLTSAVED